MHHKKVPARLIALAALIAAAFIPSITAPAIASAATSPDATSSAVTTCAGNVRYDAFANTGDKEAHLYGWFWSIPGAVCVGQADLFENVEGGRGLSERVRVRDGGANGTILAEYVRGGTINGNSITFVTHVNRVFLVSVVTVCAAVIHQSDGSVVPNTIVCKSL
jgi:hypothetical protein